MESNFQSSALIKEEAIELLREDAKRINKFVKNAIESFLNIGVEYKLPRNTYIAIEENGKQKKKILSSIIEDPSIYNNLHFDNKQLQ